ncbi:MAG: CBS domain-containing protein [Bacillota bacterium]|nr:CBS domain-containing protein [Bacillota bacterium]
MLARDVMKSPVVTVQDTATLGEVARLLDEHDISGMPVVDDAGHMVGIISELDLIRRSQQVQIARRNPFAWVSPHSSVGDIAVFTRGLCEVGETRVADAMTRKVIAVEEYDTLESVALLMAQRRINRVPVLSGGNLVGIISRADLVWAMANLCELRPGLFSK